MADTDFVVQAPGLTPDAVASLARAAGARAIVPLNAAGVTPMMVNDNLLSLSGWPMTSGFALNRSSQN